MSSERKEISVVIPTFNGAERVVNLLEGLAVQEMPPSHYEVLIVDDGSDAPVEERVMSDAYPFEMRIIRHETNRARGAACNTGIRAAAGRLVVMFDDDISVPSNILTLHNEFHCTAGNERCAAVGALEWGTGPEVTPGMFFLENSKDCFHLYPRVMHDNLPSLNTGNCSIRRDFLLDNGLFDEEFKAYGYEDIELGERLRARGLRMPFLNGANVHHHKTLDLSGIVKRQFALGRMLALYYLKNPNGFFAISSLSTFRRILGLNTEQLNREVGILAGLEELFKDKRDTFWQLPEYFFYAAKLQNVVAAYNAIGVMEGFKNILPAFEKALPTILNSLILDNNGQYEAALVEMAKVEKLMPDFLPSHHHMVHLLGEIGRDDEVLKLLDVLKAHQPEDLYTLLCLAGRKSGLGREDDAQEICREAISRPGINPAWRRRFLNMLIEILLDHGHIEEAFKEAMHCREVYATDPYLQYNNASSFEKVGIMQTAEDMFTSILAYLDQQDDCFEFRMLRSGVHYHLGTIRLNERRKEEALRDFSWSVRYDVAHRRAAEKIHELRSELGLA